MGKLTFKTRSRVLLSTACFVSESDERGRAFELWIGPDEDGVVRRRPLLRQEYAAIVLPPTLRPRALHLMHHVPTAGHPGQTKMYANMRRHFYWPHMATDVFTTVRDCVSCALERVKQRERRVPRHPFPPDGHSRTFRSISLGHSPRQRSGTTRSWSSVTDSLS